MRKTSIATTLCTLLLLGLAGCAELGTPISSLPACPHLLGTWTSQVYSDLHVSSDHAEVIRPGLRSQFEIDAQNGCAFSGHHTWRNDAITGSSFFSGVVDPATERLTLIEPGNSPARVVGQIDGDAMQISYTEILSNASEARVFGTALTRDDGEATSRICPDITGDWDSGSYNVLSVSADGTEQLSENWRMSLEVVSQDGCIFRAVDSWSDGSESGSAPIAGVIHADGIGISMIEIPTDPNSGPIGQISALLIEPGRLDLSFMGEMGDGSGNIAFATALSQSGTAPQLGLCPDITGSWAGEAFEAFRMAANGTKSSVQRTARELVISDQIDCLISGQNRWADDEGVMNSEYFVGVMDASSERVRILELDPHPLDGTTVVITGRMIGSDAMLSEYAGFAADGSFAQVFSQLLMRE